MTEDGNKSMTEPETGIGPEPETGSQAMPETGIGPEPETGTGPEPQTKDNPGIMSKILWAALGAAILSFLLKFTEMRVENGVLVYFRDYGAIFMGFVTILIALISLFSNIGLKNKNLAIIRSLIAAGITLVGIFKVIYGFGLIPSLVSEHSGGFTEKKTSSYKTTVTFNDHHNSNKLKVFSNNKYQYRERENRENINCSEKDTYGCLRAAERILKSNPNQKDLVQALKYYDSGCKFKNSECCFKLGLYHHLDSPEPRDYKKALEYYNSGCNLNHEGACNNIGYFYEFGIGVKTDMGKSLEYRKKACSLKSGIACYHLGFLYKKQNNETESMKFSNSACNVDYKEACLEIGEYYYHKNKFDDAKNYLVKACGLKSAQACYDIVYGIKAKKFELIEEYYKNIIKNNCTDTSENREKNEDFCFEYGRILSLENNFQDALKYFKSGCDKNFALSCKLVGNYYYDGKGVKKDFEITKKYFEKACRLNDNESCNMLFSHYKEKKEYAKGKALGEALCRDKSIQKCLDYGIFSILENGKDVAIGEQILKKYCDNRDAIACWEYSAYLFQFKKKIKESIPFLEKSCELGYARACFDLYGFYSTGKKIKKDREKAKKYKQMACKSGIKEACKK